MTIVLYINGRARPFTLRLFRRTSPISAAIRARIELARQYGDYKRANAAR